MIQKPNHQQRALALCLLLLIGASTIVAACQPRPISPASQSGVVAPETSTPTAFPEVAFTPSLTDMNEMAEIKAVFNAYPDAPRLLLLLSPT